MGEDKLIWQPEFYSSRYDFSVNLDWDFAKEMIEAQSPHENQDRLNQLKKEDLKIFGVDCPIPYIFHEGSCFVSQVSIGRNGVWLATDHQSIDSLLRNESSAKHIKYNSHNVDASRDAYTLMSLFSTWINYAGMLKER